MKACFGFLLIMMLLAGCARSQQFRSDQEYFGQPNQQPAERSYYSNPAGKSPTQRVEAMGQPRKRVFIFDFWNDTPVKVGELGIYAADELRRGVFTTQRVVLPIDVKTELGTGDFVEGADVIKTAQLIREGRRLGVSIVVIGRVTKAIFRQRGDEVGILRQRQSLAAADVEMKVFDTSIGREITAAARSGEASSNAMVAFEGGSMESPEYRAELTRLAVRNAVVQLVPELMRSIEKLVWQGKVIKLQGPKIYVNAGRASGLIGGDILKVMGSGDDIYDPSSGAYLGRSQGQIKGTLEVVDFIGEDGAVAQAHTGGNFQEGDIVQLY